jgi:APA family basic amino acid/polyamine antiporter
MISNMIGVGILTLPGIVAMSLGSPGLALGAWALGGVVTLCGALVHAELGCRYPLAGGDYVYLRKAFGEPGAFLSGWTSFVVGFPGAIAASVMAAAAALLDAGGWSGARGLELTVALGLLLALSLLHAAGLRPGKGVQNVLAAGKLAILVGLVAGGWMLVEPGRPETAAARPGGPSPAVAALIILFAYSGWNAAGYMAGEIRTPRTDLPRALIGGVLVVTALYLAVNMTYFRVVPVAEMGHSINVGGEVARRAFGDAGGRVLSIALAFVFLGGASAMILTGPRIYFAMARDGLFPQALASVGQRSRAPVRALWLQSLWSALLLVAGTALTPASQGAAATFERIVSWTTFAILPFAALTASAVFVFRRRDRARDWTPSFSAPGYPWTAAAFVGAAALVAAAFVGVSGENRENAIVGLALVLSGLPVYFLWSRRGQGTPCRRALVLLLLTIVPLGARGEEPAPAARKLIELGWDEPDTAFLRQHIIEMEATPFDGCVYHVSAREGAQRGRVLVLAPSPLDRRGPAAGWRPGEGSGSDGGLDPQQPPCQRHRAARARAVAVRADGIGVGLGDGGAADDDLELLS